MNVRVSPFANGQIEVSPALDVVLVLIAVIALSSPQRHVIKFGLVPPHSTLAHLPEAPVVLDLRRDHTYTLNSQPVTKAALLTRLQQVFLGRRVSLLFIRVAGNVQYGELLEVAGIAEEAGVKTLALLPVAR